MEVIDQDDTDNMRYAGVYGYDIETYPNWFSMCVVNMQTDERWMFEISPRMDHADEVWNFLWARQQAGDYMLGFNNLHFDAQIIQHVMDLCYNGIRPNAMDTYMKAQAIIDAPRGDWTHSIWESDLYIKQIDVYKLMHFDRMGQNTSLKFLEIAMRSVHVEGLPQQPGTDVPPELYDHMNWYNAWDVDRTIAFAKQIWDRIEFRFELDRTLGGRHSRVNWNDVRIGTGFIEAKLKDIGVSIRNSNKKVNQTNWPNGIKLADIMLPVEFDAPELKAIYNYFLTATVMPDQTKGFFDNLKADVGGMTMHFGTGGLHGAVPSTTYRADDTRMIQLADVTGYYPSLLVANGWYPKHLGPEFVDIFRFLIEERKKYAKSDMQAKLYKLSANGSFGNFASKYSFLKDESVLLSITVNGQLLLARLAEVLNRIPSLTLIQVNTDGVCYICDRSDQVHVDAILRWWEDWTGLGLECDDYRLFAQRDVNSYIATETGDKVKYKGAYTPVAQRQWHQDRSSGVIQLAVSAFVLDGIPLVDTIYQHTDAYDFMLAVKIPRSSKLMHGDTQVQNVCRYHIALSGFPLIKVMPPLAARPDEWREIAVQKGWPVKTCNYAGDFDWHALNRTWYVQEAEALVRGLGL